MQMSPHLVALTDGADIPLSKPIILIGRHQECDIQIPSRKISRRHCCLAQVNNYLVVRDLGSTNGIRINGLRVEEGNLHAGDELTIGNLRYLVRWVDDRPMPIRRQATSVPPPEVDESADEPLTLPDAPEAHPAPSLLGSTPPAQPDAEKSSPALPQAPLRPFDHPSAS